MKVKQILRSIFVTWLFLLNMECYATDCSSWFLLASAKQDALFAAKLKVIDEAGWKIEFDPTVVRAGFFENWNFDFQYLGVIEAKINALKKHRQPIPTKLRSEYWRAGNIRQTIVVDPSSNQAKSDLISLVEHAYYLETVDFVGFREFLQSEISQSGGRILSGNLLEDAYLAVRKIKAVNQASREMIPYVEKSLETLEVRFGVSPDVIRKLWQTEVPEKLRL